MTDTPTNDTASGLPPGVPPQQPQWPSPAGAQPRESRGVAFFVAIFLGILLLVSAGLNVLLLLLSVGSIAGGGLGDTAADYGEVHVTGARSASRKILQISVRGAIAEGANPLMGAAGGTVSQVQRALRYADRQDFDGLLLYIDSPGGGVTDSDRVYKMLRQFRADHPDVPVAALYGDMCGALLPLGDVFKSKCYELAVHINRHPQRFGFDEPPLPESTITKPPSAELRPDQQDADSLPTYDRLDRVLEAWIEQGVAEDVLPEPDLVGEILPMVQRSEFKRRQAPVVLKVSPKAFGPGRHIPVVARTRD